MKRLCAVFAGIAMLLNSCSENLPHFPEVGEPYAITKGPQDHLLANYFGINAWSPDGRYVCVLGVDFSGRLPEEIPLEIHPQRMGSYRCFSAS